MIIHIAYISLKKDMLKALKRNQIIIFAIALMLVTAGYLNYSMQTEQTAQTAASFIEQENIAGLGDATLVSSNNVIDTTAKEVNSSSISTNIASTENDDTENASSITSDSEQTSSELADDTTNTIDASSETVKTNSQSNEDLEAYFTESRLERDNMYSEMLESYQSILANSNISSEQKTTAQTEISKINSQKNAIMIAENLIKNKGFSDIIIFVNNESVSIVVRADKLEEAEIAQIQSIVQRELNVNVENIHISNK